MEVQWKKIFVFLKEFVWSQLGLKDYVRKHRIAIFSVFTNVVLFILFIFFAEQTIVRTTMYRAQKEEIVLLKNQVNALSDKRDELNIRIKYLNNVPSCESDATLTTDRFMGEYDEWLERSAETTRARREAAEERSRERFTNR